jgi:CheY-like chemotaxis protein
MLPEPARRLAVAVRAPKCADQSPVILLVTSDRELRESAASVLRGRGYLVLAAHHAGHAVLACMDAPRVDVAAIELSMDDMSGPVLAERLRRRCPGLQSLYLAKAGTPECDGVLVRPFSRDDLVDKLIVTTEQRASTLRS